MTHGDETVKQLLDSLMERAKELNCLYQVDEALGRLEDPIDDTAQRLVNVMPAGWQYPEVCVVRLELEDGIFEGVGFRETEWKLSAPVNALGEQVGEVAVYYTEERPVIDEGPFLKEERKLINTIAERIGLWVLQRRFRQTHDSWESTMESVSETGRGEWDILLDFLRRTEPELLMRITRKMINQLIWVGVEEAQPLLEAFHAAQTAEAEGENLPLRRGRSSSAHELISKAFSSASRQFSEDEMVRLVHNWLEEEKCMQLMNALEQHLGVGEIADALSRVQSAAVDEDSLPVAVQRSLRTALLQELFSEQMEFVNAAKDNVRISDFYPLFRRIIHPPRSCGKLGGKGAGIFLAAQILKRIATSEPLLTDIRLPKTWYVTSDTLLHFMRYNNLADLYSTKYQEIDRIRREYPHVIQVFKNSKFPPDIVNGLSAALDEFGEQPLIVRSSSLLEDRHGTAFSGKYKSLFLANQGTKGERLDALQDAIAEVYASVFGPDPMRYRAEHGLLDVHEEMGILIQEVVGEPVGPYFFPAFAGVAFSNNEFRWSSRIRREDGLVRMVPGLGTRAVDRLTDDYPVLLAPGQPGLRVNLPADEVLRYCPKRMDLINLQKNRFETVETAEVLNRIRGNYPSAKRVVSIIEGDRVRRPVGLEPDWDRDEVAVTFQGLFSDTPFVRKVQAILQSLRDKLGYPVDVEFACDSEYFYLLQCRAQSYSPTQKPAPIPRRISPSKVVFSARRYVSNGHVPNVGYIVFVNPEAYANLESIRDLKRVGRAVSELNRTLPKRRFILMGPGRWGSRGDIKLGVDVTYSDISNTAVLIEIARKKGSYLPELSFGTHFFQDLVEADIRYIPLYPDDADVAFNDDYLKRSPNILGDILPKYADLGEVVRVIDVRSVSDGELLDIRMNADLDEAVGYVTGPVTETVAREDAGHVVETPARDHWQWRMAIAEHIAAHVDPSVFGVRALYVIGSTKNGTAGPDADIDLIIHADGREQPRRDLAHWLDGWSRSLAHMNYLRTGVRTDRLLDIYWVSDADVEGRTGIAAKIDAVTDAARPLEIGTASQKSDLRSQISDF